MFYQGKWSGFLHWCHGWNLSPCKASIPQKAEFFLYLHRELKLLVPAVKSYCSVLNHVFSLAGLDLADNHIICRMYHSLEKSAHRKRLTLPMRYRFIADCHKMHNLLTLVD